ncbi:MAG: hypothetical protein A2V99_02690 [Spirochaetes bacterium RBG_16_67_19]|nr:MAG: hypothetical protein A2064_12825 [Spirochaetes bacterium GWB1_66_5]OHD75583.1 MAG: hypothetical protein A2V99_02690 [Spirochaetes bacterium RBG_16_67_19]
MPLRPQSIVLWSGFVLAAGHLVFLGTLAWLLLFGARAEALAALSGSNGLPGPAGQPPWWTLLARLPSAPAALACGLAGILAVSGLGVAAVPLVGRLFRRTSAPELFFLMLFLASLSLEVWRAANLLFHLLPVPAAVASAATRAVLFGRLFGLSCLLASSLYAAGLKYSHYPAAAGAVVLLAFTLAAVQPVDATTLAPSFLYGLGDPQGYRAIGAALAALSVASFLAAALIRHSPRFALAGAGAALLLAGRALAGYGASPAAAAFGVLALAAGTYLFVRQIAVYYLWV